MWNIGDEFIELSRGAFIRAQRGHGTHVWNGKKIVEKPKKKKGKKKDAE